MRREHSPESRRLGRGESLARAVTLRGSIIEGGAWGSDGGEVDPRQGRGKNGHGDIGGISG
jgi:hypothetical protein